MAQSGFTPIQLYSSTVTGHAPTSAELANGEMAINTVDGIMFYKNASGNIAQFASAAGLVWQTVQTANFTAATGYVYPINTTSGVITVTLPATPGVGSSVCFVDYAGTFATNNVTINPNGNKIQGSGASSTLNVNRSAVTMVYANSTEGWVAYSSFNNPNVTPSYSVNYLVAAGGGGGGSGGYCGGGGAGGMLTGAVTVTSTTTYPIVVGAGGATTVNGVNSSAFCVTAIGGGHGYGQFTGVGNGGSGGGGCGSGTVGQGNAGGPQSAAGGGGAGAAGAAGACRGSGVGGIGLQSSIIGTATYYAGGGGGATSAPCSTLAGAAGGLGGGGHGANYDSGGNPSGGSSGTIDTGGGGGAGGHAGGSGVVILSMPTASYSGVTTGSPTVITSGSNTILTYTSSGSYTA